VRNWKQVLKAISWGRLSLTEQQFDGGDSLPEGKERRVRREESLFFVVFFE